MPSLLEEAAGGSPVERVLHRANTMARLQRGVAAGFERIEVDLRYAGGKFILSHDIRLGRWTLGRSGVEFSRRPWLPIHRGGPFLRLPTVLERTGSPLYIDLKGGWSPRAMEQLSRLLDQFERGRDVLASNRWHHLDRIRRVAPGRPLVYSLPGPRIRTFLERIRSGDRPFGVSVDANLLPRSPGLVERLHDAGLFVYAWNIHSRRRLAEVAEAAVDGAIFPDPSWAV